MTGCPGITKLFLFSPFLLCLAACSIPEQASYEAASTNQSTKVGGSTGKTLDVPMSVGAVAGLDWEAVRLLNEGIESQKSAGFPDYDPTYAYVVDPSKQEMTVIYLRSRAPVLKIPVGTGKRGLGFGGAQTPIGFFTMGGVRIAKDASAYIQTGDSRTGVSGIYAEMLYPPSHPTQRLQGRVPNNVIIHGFNPSVSQMLRDRHRKNLIGNVPCTTGCPVPKIEDLPKLVPFIKESAGEFDPASKPNSALRSLIRSRKVVEYSRKGELGDPILILDRPFRG